MAGCLTVFVAVPGIKAGAQLVSCDALRVLALRVDSGNTRLETETPFPDVPMTLRDGGKTVEVRMLKYGASWAALIDELDSCLLGWMDIAFRKEQIDDRHVRFRAAGNKGTISVSDSPNGFFTIRLHSPRKPVAGKRAEK